MKKFVPVLAVAILVGCASDPLMTGEAHDWVGHTKADLIAGLGEPAKVVLQSNGTEVLDYVDAGYTLTPGLGHSKLKDHGNIADIKSSELPPHESNYQNLKRFEIRNGKVVKWYEEHSVDGRVVFRGH